MKSFSFRFQIILIFVILLTVLSHTAVDYFNSYREIPRLLTQVQTQFVTRSLGNCYNSDGGWQGLEENLAWLDRENSSGNVPSVRIVVRDRDGMTLYNSFARLSRWDDKPLVEGSRTVIRDSSGEAVGTVAAYIEKAYLKEETLAYLAGSFFQRLLWSLTILFFVFLLARVSARKLIRPVTALTSGMERIARGDSSELLPVLSSDELGRMSQAFNDMADALEEQKEMRKRLIGDISHDLGTPLNRIRLEARGISDSLTTPEKGFARIIGEVDKLRNLTADLDWLGETDSGAVRLKRRDTDLGRLAEEETERWRLRGESRRILLEVENRLPPGLLCSVDPDRTGQALGNLLDNALKYSSPGGRIRVSCQREDSRAVISVEDEGPGVNDGDLPRIFDRFYRADTSRSGEGRGLGLAIVKQIMELQGGSVSVLSAPGEGTLFRLYFPC